MLPAWPDEDQIPETTATKTAVCGARHEPWARVNLHGTDRPLHRLRPRTEFAKGLFNLVRSQRFRPEDLG
jgi:hypothetical protein